MKKNKNNKELSEMSLNELWHLFPVILKKHSKRYFNNFNLEKENIKNIIGKNNIFRISHIGSTYIKGLVSKPTVDILLELNDFSDIFLIKDKLLADNWILMSENSETLVFNKGYTKNGFEKNVFHLHIRLKGDYNELYFRDYLNDNKKTCKEYVKLKKQLKKKYKFNRDAYTEGKTEFIKKYSEIAKKLYKNRYKP